MREMTCPANPLRILHLASSERWTGVAEPVVSLAVQQQKMGHRVWVGCAPGRSFERKARARGLEVLDGIHLNRRLNPLDLLSDQRFVPRFCSENEVDIVHCHLLHDHWLSAWSLKKLRAGPRGRPFLVRTLHMSRAPRNDWFHRRLYRKHTDRLVCISQDAARRAEEALAWAAGTIEHVGGGVDLERFHPARNGSGLREEFSIPPNAPVAGLVARMRAGRGVRWMLRSIPAVLEQLPNAHFVMVGRGEQKKWFKQEILQPAYRGQVHYAGYRKDDGLPQAYAAMDAALFLGLGSEGTCRSILEAMACGKAVVAAEDGRTGVLVRRRDVDDLTKNLIALLCDRPRCAEMGRVGRQRAEQRFSESARAEAFSRIYEQMIREKSGGI